ARKRPMQSHRHRATTEQIAERRECGGAISPYHRSHFPDHREGMGARRHSGLFIRQSECHGDSSTPDCGASRIVILKPRLTRVWIGHAAINMRWLTGIDGITADRGGVEIHDAVIRVA